MSNLSLVEAPAKRGLGKMPCPLCGEVEAIISLNLADGELHCAECDNPFTAGDLKARIAIWQRVLLIRDMLPIMEGE